MSVYIHVYIYVYVYVYVYIYTHMVDVFSGLKMSTCFDCCHLLVQMHKSKCNSYNW